MNLEVLGNVLVFVGVVCLVLTFLISVKYRGKPQALYFIVLLDLAAVVCSAVGVSFTTTDRNVRILVMMVNVLILIPSLFSFFSTQYLESKEDKN